MARPIVPIVWWNQPARGFFDGGSRGVAGPTGAGWVLYAPPDVSGPSGLKFHDCGYVFLGDVATPNAAEYQALIALLRAALRHGVRHLRAMGDSQLVVRQVCGRTPCRAGYLSGLHAEAQALCRQFETVCIDHVPREGNLEADALSNMAMDSRGSATGVRVSKTKVYRAAHAKARRKGRRSARRKLRRARRRAAEGGRLIRWVSVHPEPRGVGLMAERKLRPARFVQDCLRRW